MKYKASPYFSAAITMALGLSSAQATDRYWDVNGTTAGFSTVVGAWNTGLFWGPNATGTGGTYVSAPTAADDLNIVSATTNTGTITVTGAKIGSSITFASGVGAVTIAGGTSITIGGTGALSGIFNASAANQTISTTPLILRAASTALSFSNSAGGLLTIGAVTGAATTGTQTITTGSSSTGGITLNGIIGNGAGGGTVALTVNSSGAGVTTLSGVNTYTGTTTVTAGTLAVGNNLALQSSALDTTGAGVVTFTGFTAPTIGGLSGAVDLATKFTTGYSSVTALTLKPSAGSQTYSGAIANGAMSLTKSGAGTQILSGTNTYTGGTSITAGTLQFANLASMPASGAVTATSATLAVNLGGGGTEWSTGTSGIGTIGGLLSGLGGQSGSTVAWSGNSFLGLDTTNAGGTQTYSGIIANTGTTLGVTKLGTGTLVLDQANTYTGTTTVANGTLQMTGNRTATQGGLTAGSIAGQTGTLEISNGNFSTGTADIILGSAVSSLGVINQTAGIVATTSTTTSNGRMLVGSTASSTGTYNLSGGSLTVTGAGSTSANANSLILGTADNSTANFNLSSNGSLVMTPAGAGTFSLLQIGRSNSTTTGSSGTFTQSGTSSASIVNLGMGGATNSNNTSILNLSGGTFTASGSFIAMAAGNTSTAAISISGTADVTLPAFPTARGTGSTATITFDGGVLKPTAASTTYMGGLTSATIQDGGAKFEVATGKDITITQALLTHGTSLGGGLTKAGVGKLTLSGVNTYTGATVIQDAGTLALDATGTINASSGVDLGTAGTFDVSAKSGYSVANLNGSGDVIGALTVSTALAIGNSPGTIDFSAGLTLGNSSTYNFELVGGTTGANSADLGNVNGLLTIGTGVILDLAQFGAGAYTLNDKFTLFSYDTLSGTFNGLADGAQFTDAGGIWQINYNDTVGTNGGSESNFVTITAIPEPEAALLGGLGLLGILRRRRN